MAFVMMLSYVLRFSKFKGKKTNGRRKMIESDTREKRRENEVAREAKEREEV